jgi:hypothetical protein
MGLREPCDRRAVTGLDLLLGEFVVGIGEPLGIARGMAVTRLTCPP